MLTYIGDILTNDGFSIASRFIPVLIEVSTWSKLRRDVNVR
jgi:hypothetical protein